jgi:hypothetical protein
MLSRKKKAGTVEEFKKKLDSPDRIEKISGAFRLFQDEMIKAAG